MANKALRINDTVSWRDSWGAGEIHKVKVTGLSVTDEPNEKYGEEVEEVEWSVIQENRVVVSLERRSGSTHWAYSYQIAPKGEDPRTYHHQQLYTGGWY